MLVRLLVKAYLAEGGSILYSVLSSKIASATDIGATVGDKLDSIYKLIFVFMIIWLSFKLHNLFRSIFKNLGGGR